MLFYKAGALQMSNVAVVYVDMLDLVVKIISVVLVTM